MFFTRIKAFFMLIVAFFNILFAGYIRYYPRNRIFLDQNYAGGKDPRQTYDLVIPKSLSGSSGLILCIHGGGWVEGSKDSYTDCLFRAADEKGFAAACVNYRYVSENVGFDDVMDDISSALRAIRERGGEFGVDFDRVLLAVTYRCSTPTREKTQLPSDRSASLSFAAPPIWRTNFIIPMKAA